MPDPVSYTHLDVYKRQVVSSVTIGGNEAKFYKDDNGSQTYIRYTYPENTTLDTFKNVTVSIVSSKTVSSSDVTITKDGTTYTFTADMLNNAPTITISGKKYIVAVGATDSKWDLTAKAEAGYVSAATLSGTDATVTKNLYGDKYPGNVYYTQQKSTWITVNNRIDAKNITATDISLLSLIHISPRLLHRQPLLHDYSGSHCRGIHSRSNHMRGGDRRMRSSICLLYTSCSFLCRKNF